jgi:hypothetical protein
MTAATAAAIDAQCHSTAPEVGTGPTATAAITLQWDSSLQKWTAQFTQTESSRMEVSENGNVTIHWNEEDTTARLVLEMDEKWNFASFLVGWDRETGIPVGEAPEVRYSAFISTPAAQRLVVDLERPEGEGGPVFGYIFEAGMAAEPEAFVVGASKARIVIDPKITNKGDG